MKKIIFFGATGKVGTYVVDYALRFFNGTDYKIIATGRRKTDFFDNVGIEYHAVDITKETDFSHLPQEDVYGVVILAAQLPTKSDGQDIRKQINVNLIGNFNIFEYCKNVKVDRVLFCQTIFDVAGHLAEEKKIHPDLPVKFSYTDDHAPYVICKNASLELLEHYHQVYGTKKFVFRLPTIYAYNAWPYMYKNGKKVMRPLYVMIHKAMNSEPIEIWGDPNYAKDMIHVYDFAQMLCRCLLVDREKGFYNAGTGSPVTLEEQIRTIVKVFSPAENPSPISYAPEKISDGGCIMDITNAQRELGYVPEYDCLKLFQDFKKEMELDRFYSLRTDERYQ